MSSIYDMDMKTKDYISKINEEINVNQNKVFSLLLKISQGIKENKLSKEELDQLFKDVENLRSKIKNSNDSIKDVVENMNRLQEFEKKEEKENSSSLEVLSIDSNSKEEANVSVTNDIAKNHSAGQDLSQEQEISTTEEMLKTIDELSKSLSKLTSAESSKSVEEKATFDTQKSSKIKKRNGKDCSDDEKLTKNNEVQMIVVNEKSLSNKIKKLFIRFEKILKRK